MTRRPADGGSPRNLPAVAAAWSLVADLFAAHLPAAAGSSDPWLTSLSAAWAQQDGALETALLALAPG